MVHLSRYPWREGEYVYPAEMTQEGMANRLGISRAHAALELKRLRERDYVEWGLGHVKDARTRRKIYFLSSTGRQVAAELKDEARRKNVKLLDGPVTLECLGHEAVEILTSRGLSETEALIKILTSEAISISSSTKNADGQTSLWRVEIVGRNQEIDRLNRWIGTPGKAVAVLTGADGVGKTALARHLASKMGGLVVMTVVRPGQSTHSLLSEIATRLKAEGKDRLKKMLERDDYDAQETALTLVEDMAGGLLVVDEMHNSPEVEEFAARFLPMNNWPIKVLLVGKRKPDFCRRWSDTFQKPYEDVPVGCLSMDSARKLLETRGSRPTDEGLLASYEAVQGRTLDLILLAELGWSFKTADAPNLSDLTFSHLEKEEVELLGLAAIRQSPIDPARTALSPAQESLLRRSTMFSEHEGRYSLHESLRDLVIARMSSSEKSSLHAKAAAIGESQGDIVEAATQYLAAGMKDEAVDSLATAGDSLPFREMPSVILSLLRALGDVNRLEHVRGRALESVGRLEEARGCYERALAGAAYPASVDLMLRLGRLETQMSLLRQAEAHCNAAADASRDNKDELRRARAVQLLAQVFKTRGEREQSISHLSEACEILRGLGEQREAARCRGAIGLIELENGNLHGAVGQLTKSVLDTVENNVETAEFLRNLGVAHHRLGDVSSALEEFKKSVEVAKSFGQAKTIARSLTNAAESCLEVGKRDEANDFCHKALRLGERLDDPVLLSSIHATLGSLNRVAGLWAKAESHLVTSIELLKPLKLPGPLAERYRDLASLYETTGDTRKARLWHSRADKLMEWEEPKDSQMLATSEEDF